VKIIDGPLGHSRHICAFICYGTAVHLTAETTSESNPTWCYPSTTTPASKRHRSPNEPLPLRIGSPALGCQPVPTRAR
jgi:hypothetical protein